MDFDRSKHNVIKYLPTNNDENIWGMLWEIICLKVSVSLV